jgi:pimeloyl-ACP methyl ester carboxylesterase
MNDPVHALSFRTADGLTLRGERWGAGGCPAVFTQANGLPVQCYRAACGEVAALAEVHALNSRGNGGSDVPAALPDWDLPLADLRGYIERTFGEPVLLIGHSFGAILSLRLAAEAPHLVRGLLLLEPVILAGRGEDWAALRKLHGQAMIDAALRRRDRWPSRKEAEERLRGRGIYAGWAEPALRAFLEHGLLPEGAGVKLACPPWLEAATYGTHPGTKMFAWAERMRLPAVLFRGASSDAVHPGAMAEMASLMGAEVAVMPGGHTFPMEHPRETARTLAGALRRVLAAQTRGGSAATGA